MNSYIRLLIIPKEVYDFAYLNYGRYKSTVEKNDPTIDTTACTHRNCVPRYFVKYSSHLKAFARKT